MVSLLIMNHHIPLHNRQRIIEVPDVYKRQDMRLVDETKRWLLSLERKAPLKQREFAVKYLEKQDFILAKQKERMAAQGEIIEQQQTVISEQLGAILHQNQAPVSYTHLDVYKRQNLHENVAISL